MREVQESARKKRNHSRPRSGKKSFRRRPYNKSPRYREYSEEEESKTDDDKDSGAFQVFVHSVKGTKAMWVTKRTTGKDIIARTFPELSGSKIKDFHLIIDGS